VSKSRSPIIASVSLLHGTRAETVQRNFASWYNEWNHGTVAEGATYILGKGASRWASAHILVLAKMHAKFRLHVLNRPRYL